MRSSNSRRCKSNLLKDFRYFDLTEREQRDVKDAMERYNLGGTKPAGLQAKYKDPDKFYEQIIKRYGWNAVSSWK
jgi:hypothetical protein